MSEEGHAHFEGRLLSHSSLASFPGSPGMRICIAGRAWYLFLHKHDIIELKQKGNVLCVLRPTMRSTLGVYDI